MTVFFENDPSNSSFWRSIILYGKNVASYKFALAKSIIEIKSKNKEFISLEELSGPFSSNICEHLRNYEKQITRKSDGIFLENCKKFNQGEINKDKLIEVTKKEAFKVVIDIVLMGTWNCTSTIGKEMIKNKKGNVLSIVTTYAWTGSPYVVPSAAAKAGVLAMTRSLAVEWGKHNIRFNAIAPGPFPTKGAWSRLMPPGFEDFEDGMKDKIPMKRFGERHELENLASYLMSDGSAYINGEVVTIDGGEWLAGAAEFSQLSKIPDSMWKAMAERRKKK